MAAEALAADKQLRTVGETSGLLASTEHRSSTISGSTDCSIARTYDNLADYTSDEVKKVDSTHSGESSSRSAISGEVQPIFHKLQYPLNSKMKM